MQCQSIVESYSGIEHEYGNRHISCQTEVHHESSVERTQAYTHHFAQDVAGIQEHIAEHDFEIIWTKVFAEAEVANRIVDAVPIDPNGRVSEPVEPAAAAGGQLAAMEANVDGKSVDSTPINTEHAAQYSLFTSAECIARAWRNASHALKNCTTSLCA